MTIHDKQGNLLEVGDAVQQQKEWWKNNPRVQGRISVSAWDLPGNHVHQEFEKPVR